MKEYDQLKTAEAEREEQRKAKRKEREAERAAEKAAQKDADADEAEAAPPAKVAKVAKVEEEADAGKVRKREAAAAEPISSEARVRSAKRVKIEADDDADDEPFATEPPSPAAADTPRAQSADDGVESLEARATACVTRLAACLPPEGGAALADASGAADALASLESMPMDVMLLASSGAGKVVNKLRKVGGSLAPRAKALVDRWKAMSLAAQG